MRLPGLGLLLLWQHLGRYDIYGEVISRLAVTVSARLRSVMVYKSLQGKKIPDYKKHLLIEWREVCQIPQCLDAEARRVGNGAHLRLGEGVLKQGDKCQAGSWALCRDICLGAGLETFRGGLL